jgi:hypothetical protein
MKVIALKESVERRRDGVFIARRWKSGIRERGEGRWEKR